MKRINLFFYYQRIYRRKKNYRWKIHRCSISVGDSVGKLITDGICVLHRWKNFVGKTVKFCSVFNWLSIKPSVKKLQIKRLESLKSKQTSTSFLSSSAPSSLLPSPQIFIFLSLLLLSSTHYLIFSSPPCVDISSSPIFFSSYLFI